MLKSHVLYSSNELKQLTGEQEQILNKHETNTDVCGESQQ